MTLERQSHVRSYIAATLTLATRIAEYDPGMVRLTQAARTVLSVAITVLIFQHTARDARMFAGMATAFLCQCRDPAPRRKQQATMLIATFAMAILGGLAAEGHAYAQWTEWPLLICVAFLAFYVRRFLSGPAGFTTFPFTYTLVCSAVPVRPGAAAAAALAGGCVAFIVVFRVFPERTDDAFSDAVKIVCRRIARSLRALSAHGDHRLSVVHRERRSAFPILAFLTNLVDNPGQSRITPEHRAVLASLFELVQAARSVSDSAVSLSGDTTVASIIGALAAQVGVHESDHQVLQQISGIRAHLATLDPDEKLVPLSLFVLSAGRLAAVNGNLLRSMEQCCRPQ